LSLGTNEIACEFEVFQPGEFTNQIHLYVDDGGTREIVFTVRGVAKAADASPRQAP
jgi:hypothetical protein